MSVIIEKRLIPNYQFTFSSKYATVKQIHRIINKITLAFEAGKYCSAVFLDVSQASEIWHDGHQRNHQDSSPSPSPGILSKILRQACKRASLLSIL